MRSAWKQKVRRIYLGRCRYCGKPRMLGKSGKCGNCSQYGTIVDYLKANPKRPK